MVIGVAQLTLDVVDVETEAAFWSAALGYRIDRGDDGNVHVRSSAADSGISIWLRPTGEPKQTKNRLHVDFDAEDPAAEIERLFELGAQRCDVGQTGDETFIVLADPEGNEFCVYKQSRAERRRRSAVQNRVP